MALNDNALLTLNEAKDHLDIPLANTSQDTRIERFINASSEIIENKLDRVIRSLSYEEVYSGRDSDRLLLKQWPVTAITQVVFNASGDFSDADDIVETDDYDIEDETTLLFRGIHAPRGNGNIEVTYTAGYSAAPADLKEVCYWMVEYFYNLRGDRRIGQANKTKGDESVTFLQDWPTWAQNVLKKYRRMDFSQGMIVGNG